MGGSTPGCGERADKVRLQGAYEPFSFSPDGKTLAAVNAGDRSQAQLWDVASGQLRATVTGHTDIVYTLVFSPDGKALVTRDYAGKVLLWDVALGKPILVTPQTSLAQFPPAIAHPISQNDRLAPTGSLLDPCEGHVLATLQPLRDAPAYLAAPLPDTPGAALVPTTGGEWITITAGGYFEGSANLAAFIRWNVDGVLYPAAAYWDLYYRLDRVRQALKIPGE